ncbi:glycerol-3-phosphate 1-O-acyltransferase PlsY [Aquisalimonas asiatica]|uniref:Glycerol-3-phosphate acyltransferase n=1 Tax=Aquisalimonas asiatica TaxID=406100 RepID=A0A1H8V6L9_9GAMM|nr:glycerol-3-phosphate 1-O-acyltransferase PlsY [Aquisalimonas asiatica]SEP10927.1 acyl-phosphate glycerol-3-phosphate acyltransferase [Aquisalimonas asiatica]
MIIDVVLIVAAYLFGSISAAILTCRAMGLPDPRSEGSRNPGATNVLRVGNRLAAGITLGGDFIKGTIPVVIGVIAGAGPVTLALIGLAAFLGHLYPVFFRFEGGKGVATGLGVLLGWSWPALLLTIITWLAVAALFRYSSLAALVSFLLAPFFLAYFDQPQAIMLGMLGITLLTYWRHRGNLQSLLNGTEKKIGEKD